MHESHEPHAKNRRCAHAARTNLQAKGSQATGSRPAEHHRHFWALAPSMAQIPVQDAAGEREGHISLCRDHGMHALTAHAPERSGAVGHMQRHLAVAAVDSVLYALW